MIQLPSLLSVSFQSTFGGPFAITTFSNLQTTSSNEPSIGGRTPVLFAFLCTCSTTEEKQQATAHLTVHCLETHQPKTQYYFWYILKVYNQQGDVEVIAVQAYTVPGGC